MSLFCRRSGGENILFLKIFLKLSAIIGGNFVKNLNAEGSEFFVEALCFVKNTELNDPTSVSAPKEGHKVA